jgi:hypothetical protein
MPKRPRSRNSSPPWGADPPGRGEWLRSAPARTLLTAALTIPLILGGAFVAVGRLHSSAADSVEHPASTATDEQTKAEVVEQARSIVAIARLQQTTAGYLLMSCKNRDDPPYQGAVYLTFTLPADARPDTYYSGVAAAMVARGWNAGLPANQYLFGKSLSKDGVSAIIYQDSNSPDSANRGVARIYGRCRDMTDHRNDPTGWTDITDQLG